MVVNNTNTINCYNLTMDKFIACLVDKQLQVLGIEDDAMQQQVWQQITEEFSSLRNSSTTKNIALELTKEIFVLTEKTKIIQLCVTALWDRYSREVANELKTMGFNCKLDFSDKQAYYKELNLILSKAKSYTVQSQRKQKELQALHEKEKDKATYSRKEFISINNSLSKYMGYQVQDHATTVAVWADMLNKYEAYIEVQHAQVNKLQKNSRGL